MSLIKVRDAGYFLLENTRNDEESTSSFEIIVTRTRLAISSKCWLL